jgi:hypothetical protein
MCTSPWRWYIRCLLDGCHSCSPTLQLIDSKPRMSIMQPSTIRTAGDARSDPIQLPHSA